MTIDDEALVLDHHPYRDRHLILAVLSRHSGVHRGVLRRARGGKVPVAGSTQVLSHIHVSLYQRPQAELADFRRIELVTSSFPIARDLSRSAAGAVVAELLSTYNPPGEPAEKSFRLGVAVLEALLEERPPDLVVAYTQFWTLALGGILPDSDTITGGLGPDGAAFLASCRRQKISEIGQPVPETTARWLDRQVRDGAERQLRALAFYRSLAE